MGRCKWVNLNNELYVKYHDEEWGVARHDDKELLKYLILESFQSGLSWECVLKKIPHFIEAYDDFDLEKIINYKEDKINELLNNPNLIRHKGKIIASINNAKIFKRIQLEHGSFSNYIWSFTSGNIVYEYDKIQSELSDVISKDLKSKGMKFVGSVIIYSYLQAVGIINSHDPDCFKSKKY